MAGTAIAPRNASSLREDDFDNSLLSDGDFIDEATARLQGLAFDDGPEEGKIIDAMPAIRQKVSDSERHMRPVTDVAARAAGAAQAALDPRPGTPAALRQESAQAPTDKVERLSWAQRLAAKVKGSVASLLGGAAPAAAPAAHKPQEKGSWFSRHLPTVAAAFSSRAAQAAAAPSPRPSPEPPARVVRTGSRLCVAYEGGKAVRFYRPAFVSLPSGEPETWLPAWAKGLDDARRASFIKLLKSVGSKRFMTDARPLAVPVGGPKNELVRNAMIGDLASLDAVRRVVKTDDENRGKAAPAASSLADRTSGIQDFEEFCAFVTEVTRFAELAGRPSVRVAVAALAPKEDQRRPGEAPGTCEHKTAEQKWHALPDKEKMDLFVAAADHLSSLL